MAVRKQSWSSRFQSAWVLDFTHEDGARHEFWLFRTKAGAIRAMAERMRVGMRTYGIPDPVRAELESILAAGHVEAAHMLWWDLYHEEYWVDEHEIED